MQNIDDLSSSVDRQRLAAERWQETFDAISDAVLVLSPDLDIVEINQAGCCAYGVNREEVIGRRCHEVVHGTSEPIPGCPCLQARETLQPTSLRYEERGKVFDLAAWPMGRSEGGKAGCVHIIKDITANERTLREKTRLEEKLELSQRLEAIGRLAGGVAHDFNNLVSVIIANSSFVLEGLEEADPSRADVLEILYAGRRAAALTRQLLAFSRKQILKPEALSVNDVVLGLEGMLRRLLGEDMDIRVSLAEPLGLVKADRHQLEQILMNLAVNARDAMPGGGKLTIETAEAELDEEYSLNHVAVTPGRFIRLSVSDTGCGMDPHTAEHVFEPFFTTKDKGVGTGLGLSTVYGIVKQSGGNIWVHSEPGRGTTFKIYLPKIEGEKTDSCRQDDDVLVTGHETVLLVEDEAPVRRVTERILAMAGYRVIAASDGREALTICRQLGPEIDLLLTDVVMPEMCGRELSELVVAILPDIKVLFMSGYTENAIVHHGVLDAGVRLINKPFSAPELARMVRSTLDEA